MKPLAEQLRPKNLDEFVGQEHLVGKNGPIRKLLEKGAITSMIFWGPPGSGKTTLARLIAEYSDATFVSYSAVMGSIKEVREIIKDARERENEDRLSFSDGDMGLPRSRQTPRARNDNSETILFVDEIHRFNKAQQDAFLPAVEDGTITLIGATTENPGFEVNAPLISRSQLFVFKELTDKDITEIINRAIGTDKKKKWTPKAIAYLTQFSNGDARKAINAVELAHTLFNKIDTKEVEEVLQQKSIRYDKKGDGHYDTISAFIKSMRGSDPNATLHYLARMLKAGEQPEFIARRMLIFASEDIGNAKPAALILATSTMQAVKMIGMPEAQIILAQCATFLATSKKSIASYAGLAEAMADIDMGRLEPIPKHLRNAVNSVVKDLNYGVGYVRYPWHKDASGEKEPPYLPKNLVGKKYYRFKENSEKTKEE